MQNGTRYPAGEAVRYFTTRLYLFMQCAYIALFCVLCLLSFPTHFSTSPPLDYSKEPAMYWFYFFALTFGYFMGVFTVYAYQSLCRRWVERRTRPYEEHEGYTLTVIAEPRSEDEGA